MNLDFTSGELRYFITRGLSILMIGCLLPEAGKAQLPTSFQKVELVSGLKNAVNFEFAPDGRIFIADRYGELFIYKPDTQAFISAGTVDVFHDMEDGLLALAFDPQFSTNSFVYIHYSRPDMPLNRVSRFEMNGDQLDLASEVTLIEWTSDRNGYYHAAGDMDFDSDGNLYIATGDNSNHTAYAALNESDRNQSAERTASNTKDLRGKILRIKPNADGTYGIPAGNLFPDGINGRPEIYVMGARNPFRIFVDKTNTDWLFWGEVGPDAGFESQTGPEGMDEINLVKSAGNYGWPYFSGKNEPYLNTYKQPNFYYDHANPVNVSKWNTGIVNLPPARPSWLEFFHGCYLAGPRYYYNSSLNNPKKLPADFHQGFFYVDFNTSNMWLVKMDGNGNVVSNQRFAENIITGSGFIDMKIGPDGQLYILEYGAGCCPSNVGSGKLLRIDYTGINTNKPPQVSLSTDKVSGALPLTVAFSSEGTIDLDGDVLTFEWDFESDGIIDSNEPNPSFTYTTKGTFTAILRVTDSKGETISKSVLVYPGNTAATVGFSFPPDGGMFSWEDVVAFDFRIDDAEDGSTANNSISCDDVNFVPAFGHLTHSHDGLTMNQCSGSFNLNPTGHDAQGQDNIYYVFKVNYTDRDGLTVHDQVITYPKVTEAEFYTSQNNTKLVSNTDILGGGMSSVRALLDRSYIVLNNRNLHNIDSVSCRLASTVGGTIEVRADSLTGALLSTIQIPVTGNLDRWTNTSAPIIDPGGKHDLYFVFRRPGAINFLDLNYIEFIGPGISTDATPPNVYAAKVASPNELVVKFNEPLDRSSANNISNYSIDNGIQIASVVLQDDQQTVRIFTSRMEFGVTNRLSINNIKNVSGIQITSAIVQDFILDEVLARINVGGPLTEIAGVEWLASKFNTGGSVGTKPGLAINNTTADVIYQTELNGNFSVNVPVPYAGMYDLNLHLAEIVYKNPGERVFNINVENGQYTLMNVDLFSRVGFATALIEEVKNIKVVDGFLTITLTGVVNKAKLSAIEVFYSQTSQQTPSVAITNPVNGLSISQPFAINYDVSNWWIAEGSSHVRMFVDGVESKNIYSPGPVTIQGLSHGSHSIELVLVDSENTPTQFRDTVTVNVVSPSACVDNPFPSQWEEYVIGADLPYRAPQIVAADIDGDGYQDIVAGGWWFVNPQSVKGVWIRNTIGAPMNNMFLVHDLDRDGDPDVLGTNGTYLGSQLSWAENDGEGNFIVHSNIPVEAGFPPGSANNNTFLAGAAVGNFNNVSNIQIALVWNGSETTKAPVKLLTVPPDPALSTWSVADIAPNAVGESITAVDVDGDGDLDLTQAKNWLRNNNGSWTTFTTGVTLPTYYEHHVMGDFDRDGNLDGVLTQIGENQEIAWVKVPADATHVWSKTTLGTDVDSGLSLGYADLDFDGDLDIVTAEWKGAKRLIAFENDLCNSGTWIKTILHPGGTSAPDHHNGAQPVDLDNDGDLDIISVGWDKRTPRIYINNSSTISGNRPPVVLNPLVDQPAAVNVPFTYVFPDSTFSDPDSDILSYTVMQSNGSGLPAWLSFNAATRTFQGKPPSGSGLNVSVRVTASDGKGGTVSDDFAVMFTNFPPVVANPIPDQTFTGDQTSNFTFAVNTFSDPNGDALTYTAQIVGQGTLPTWLSFDAATRTFTATPLSSDWGTYLVEVSASDGQSSVSDVFQLNILDPTINHPPVPANGIPDLTASVGLPFSFVVPENTFTDADEDVLVYSAFLSDSSSLPAWLTFNDATRTFTGTPGAMDVGTLQVWFYALDEGGANASLQFSILVESGGSIRINSGGPVVSAFGATFDADKLYLGGGAYKNDKIVDITGTLYDDLYKTERNKPFVYEIPLPPGVYSVKLHFAEIYFGATGGGTGGVGSRVFNVTAEGIPLLTNFDIFAEAGPMAALVKEFEVTVTDGKLNVNFIKVVQNPKVSAIEIIPISTSSNNVPVVTAPIPDQTATTGAVFNLVFAPNTFFDPDNDLLTYSASLSDGSALPGWLSFSGGTRTFSGTPVMPASLGVRVTASDGKGGSVSDVFSLVVQGSTESPAVRINAGGPQFTTSGGALFAADRLFINGTVYTNNNVSDVLGTDDDFLYRSERYRMNSYEIPVSEGTYLLTLHFAEIYFGAPGGGPAGAGRRIFSVTAEGTTLLSNFDIYAEAGAVTALIKQFELTVTDGTLNIDFIKIKDNPKISAIEIAPVPSGAAARLASASEVAAEEITEAAALDVFPNPSDGRASVAFESSEAQYVLLQLIDDQGMMIETIFAGNIERGNIEFDIDVSHLTARIYYVRLQTPRHTIFRKVMVTRTH